MQAMFEVRTEKALVVISGSIRTHAGANSVRTIT